MQTIIHNRAWLLVLCVFIAGLYSSKYLGQSMTLALAVTGARLFIALLAGLLVSIMMAMMMIIIGKSQSLHSHTLLTLRVAVIASVLMAAGGTGTTVPDWLISSF